MIIDQKIGGHCLIRINYDKMSASDFSSCLEQSIAVRWLIALPVVFGQNSLDAAFFPAGLHIVE